MENFFNFYGIENNIEIKIVCLANTKFHTNETLCSSNRFFSMMTSLNDDITLKISITLYYP